MHTPRNFDKEPNQNFQINDCVYIERSNLDVEAWIITGHLPDNKYKVKPSYDSNIYYEEPLDELQKFNPDGPIDQETLSLINKAYSFYIQYSTKEIFIDESINIESYLENLNYLLSELEQNINLKYSPVLINYKNIFENLKPAILSKNSEKRETQDLIKEIYPNGITSDLEQGSIGTCYLLSSLKALKLHPELMSLIIKRSITKKDSNTWVVEFLGDEQNIGPIEVNKDKLNQWKRHSKLKAADGDIIFELAYASYVSRSKGRNKGTMFAEDSGEFPVEGGYAHRTLAHLLGPIGIKYRKSPNNSHYEHRSFANANDHHSIPDYFNNNYLHNRNNLVLTASSVPSQHGDKDFEWIEGEKIYKSHAYTIVDFNRNTQKILISNPHNSKRTFALSINGFSHIFYDLKFNKINRLAMITMQLENIHSEQIIREIINNELLKGDLFTITQSQPGNPNHLNTNIEYTINTIKNPLVKKITIEEINLAEKRQCGLKYINKKQ